MIEQKPKVNGRTRLLASSALYFIFLLLLANYGFVKPAPPAWLGVVSDIMLFIVVLDVIYSLWQD